MYFNIVNVNVGSHQVEIFGDYTSLFISGYKFAIDQSTGNDGVYSVASSSFGGVNTIITVDDLFNDITDPTVDGGVVGGVYTINFTDDLAKPEFYIAPHDTNLDLPIALPGRGSLNYGEMILENAVHMLENFAADTAPSIDTVGQLWFNTSDETLNVKQSVDWNIIPNKDYVDGAILHPLETMKEPTGFPTRADSTISFDEGTYTFTIAPTGTEFTFWIKGTEYTKTAAENITIANTEGMHYIYFDASGTLQEATIFSESLLSDYAYICAMYWDATNGVGVYVADERHGLTMDSQTHLHLHETFGTQFITGLALSGVIADGGGSLDSHAQFIVDNGTIRDEDLKHDILDVGLGVNVYDLEQDLDPIAQIPVMFRDGANGDWRIKPADDFPLIYDGTAGFTGTGNAPYNEFTGVVWQLTEVPNNDFVLVHYLATNDINHPIVGIQGQNSYNNLGNARDGAAVEINNVAGLPFEEFVPIATVIYQSNNGYANTPNVQIVTTSTGDDYIDWRNLNVFSSVSAGVNDHGNLSGLSDDDHLQYHNDARGDARYYTQAQVDAHTTDTTIHFTKSSILLNDLGNVLTTMTPSDGDVLTFDTINGWQSETPTTGVTTLDGLTDVVITTPADNEVLAYDNGSGDWINQTPAEANLATATDLSTHTSDATIHFTEASIDHVNIQNVGTNTHAQIDSHIADTTIHFSTLNGISDVVISTPADNEILAYDNGSGHWINQTPAEAGLSATGHTHTKADITDFVESDYVHTTGAETVGGDKTFSNNVIITGDLTVNGTTTTVNSNQVNIGDSIIVLNANETGTPSVNGGFEIERGTDTNATIIWDEANDLWKAGLVGSEVEISLLGHVHDDRYYTKTELDAGQLDTRYYTETELNTGQLDSRYYTQAQVDALIPNVVGYQHTQAVSSTTWTITHNLGTSFVTVQTFIDITGTLTQIIPTNVEIDSGDPTNKVIVTFNTARTGQATIIGVL